MSIQPGIMVSPTGARRMKADHPALPITIEETVAAAVACAAAGAEALHLHIRDDDGRHSLDADRYGEALAELGRAAPGLAVQITTEAGGLFDAEAQLDCVRRVRPSWASVAAREIDDAHAEPLYGFCAEQGVRLQHILYTPADVALLAERRRAGLVRPHQNEAIFVLGGYAAARAGRPQDLDLLLNAMPEPLRWSVCAFGGAEEACLLSAARRGAVSLRVGFENNIHRADGALWRDNAAAVASLRAALSAASSPVPS